MAATSLHPSFFPVSFSSRFRALTPPLRSLCLELHCSPFQESLHSLLAGGHRQPPDEIFGRGIKQLTESNTVWRIYVFTYVELTIFPTCRCKRLRAPERWTPSSTAQDEVWFTSCKLPDAQSKHSKSALSDLCRFYLVPNLWLLLLVHQIHIWELRKGTKVSLALYQCSICCKRGNKWYN